MLGIWIGSDANKLSRNISSEGFENNDFFFLYVQFVAQIFLRQNLSLRM